MTRPDHPDSGPDGRLEDSLRAMLVERAGDVLALPSSLADLDAIERAGADTGTHATVSPIARRSRRARSSRAWLLSAAAVAVIAAGLGVAVTAGISHPRPTPTSHTSRTSRTSHPAATAPAPTDPVDRGGPRTSVALGVAAASAVPGFYRQLAVSKPGFRWLGWQQADSQPSAIGLDDLSTLSAQAIVFDQGQFPLGRVDLPASRVKMTLAGEQVQVYPAMLQELATGKPEGRLRASLAWQYGPDRWAVVQALSDKVSSADLSKLAAAVQPTVLTPISLPFSLATPPTGTLDDIVDRRPSGTLDLTFVDGSTSTLLTIGNDPDYPESRWFGAPRTVDGLTALVSPGVGAAMSSGAGPVYLRVTSPDVSELEAVDTLLDGLTWSGSRGEGPGIPLRAAIGH